MKKIGYWIEAMRLRTLPVSVAGVLMAVAFSFIYGTFDAYGACICLGFAVLAQIASNFANEYFDYKAGRDRKGRQGPRRGVTEGEISPRAMKWATAFTLWLACCVGLNVLWTHAWWLVLVGLVVVVGVYAYSAGPYPLSTHGLGEVAVLLFFGVVPVNFTYYIMSGEWSLAVAAASLAVGLMGANVLIVNNYRDTADDSAVGKRTLCVRYGRRFGLVMYMADAVCAVIALVPLWMALGLAGWITGAVYLVLAGVLCRVMSRREGAAINPLLGATAMLMFAVAVAALIAALCQNG